MRLGYHDSRFGESRTTVRRSLFARGDQHPSDELIVVPNPRCLELLDDRRERRQAPVSFRAEQETERSHDSQPDGCRQATPRPLVNAYEIDPLVDGQLNDLGFTPIQDSFRHRAERAAELAHLEP